MKNIIIKFSNFVISTFLILTIFTQIGLALENHKQIDDLLNKYHEYGLFNGTALVAKNGKIILKKGYGYAQMEWDIPNTPDIKFRLGSITKQFTSMAIMQLLEKGKLQLVDPISKYLPYYRKDLGDKITIHQLLNHTSGIPSYTGLKEFRKNVSMNPYSPKEFVKKYCSNNLEFEPGTKYKYNNSGYFLLGAIIEEITRKSYEKYIKENIFNKLKMYNTGYDHHSEILKKRAAGYRKTDTGYINAAYLDMSVPYAAGSLYSTVEDLYIWDQVLYTDKLISAENKKLMYTPTLKNYAYGWVVIERPYGKLKKKIIAHGGGINGFNTLIQRFVDDKHLIILLNNTGGTQLGKMARGISNILYNLPHSMPKKSFARMLYKLILQEGLKKGLKRHEVFKANKTSEYELLENEFNALGYRFLGQKKIDTAIEVFKLNVSNFPKSFNAYDSLGEAYMAGGKVKLAVQNYKKSLGLNPKNKGAVEQLKKLQKEIK